MLIFGYGRVLAKYHQLFCCTRFSLGLLELISILFVIIGIRSFAYNFKDEISNLYFNLSIYCNSSTNVILALCLVSFSYNLITNISLSI